MFLRIDPGGDMPIYEQIVRQVKFAVATGGIVPGQLVPSVRELAKQAAINPNTAIRAYRILQDEGILCRLRGTGLAVTQEALGFCRNQRTELIRQRLGLVLDEALQSGLAPAAFLQLVRSEIAARDGAASSEGASSSERTEPSDAPKPTPHFTGGATEPQEPSGRE